MRFLFILVLLPFTSFAQDSVRLQEVIVSDNRIETPLSQASRNIEVISQMEIKEMPVQSVNELLQYVAGVDLRQRGPWGAQADLSIRGGNFDQVLLLLNGVQMSDPQTGHHVLNLGIDLDAIQQIEIIKGPAASRYGLNSFSGAINIITKTKDENSGKFGATLGRGENSKLPGSYFAGNEIRGGLNLKIKSSRHLLSGTTLQSSGYRANTDLNKTTLFHQSSFTSKLGDFDINSSYINNKFGASGFYAFPIDSTSEEEVETYFASIRHNIKLKSLRLKSNVYFRQNYDTYTLFRDAPQIFQNQHRTDVAGAEIHGAVTYKTGILGLGVSYRNEHIESSNLGTWTRDNLGAFLENRLYLFEDQLILNAGLYLNNTSDYGFQALPSVDFNYSLTSELSAFGSFGQSFRIPTFTDLYYVGPTNVGNAELKPEKADMYELGLKMNRGKHQFLVSGFYKQASDLIDWVRSTELEPWQPQNYASVATTGFEVNYNSRAYYSITKWLEVNPSRIGYTWLDMKDISGDAVLSRYSLNNLNHQVVGQTGLRLWKKFSVSLSGRFIDREAYTDYTLVDLRLQYSVKSVSTFIDVTNLGNTAYIESSNALMPGRWFRMGFDVKLK